MTKPAKHRRPLSPHLSIYKPQITSMLSITHRATGVFLLLGAFAFVWELRSIAVGGNAFATYLTVVTSPIGYIFSFLWVGCLFYHLFNGIRHLFWDAGFGYNLKTVTASGIAVILLSVAATIIVFISIMNKWGML